MSNNQAFAVGSRVRWGDADESDMPAYRAMRGTVVDGSHTGRGQGIYVQWDCDVGHGDGLPSGPYPTIWVAHADEGA